MTKNRVFILSLAAIGFTLACAFLFIDRAQASPAAPVVVTLTQPDGSTFTARAWGDEWNNGVETLDGYSILRTPAGWWAYASFQADGSLGPAYSGSQLLLVGMPLPAELTPHLRSTASRENPRTPSRTEPAEPGLKSPEAPGAGAINTLVLLAKFSDRSETYSAASFQELMFSTSSSSVWKYFNEVSYNNLDIIPAAENCGAANDGITEWTDLGYNHPDTGGYTDYRNQQIVKDVLIANDGCIDYSAFDVSKDGYIDSRELTIVVVVAGFESSVNPTDSPSVWAHQWALDEVIPPILDGKVIGNSAYGGYTQIGEVHTDHQATIGVVVHEFGHLLNWPDLYDIDGTSSGVGDWSVMGTGNWNRTSLAGDSPAHPDAWLKWYLGWITPTAVSLTMSAVDIQQAEDSPVAYLLRLNPGGVNWELGAHSGTGEYFLVENRQKTLYDAGLPGCGLLIWHIDESVTSTNSANANEGRPLVALVQGDGDNHLYYGDNNGDHYDPYPGDIGRYHYSFTTDTTPNSKLYSGDSSFVSLRVTETCSATMTVQYLTYAPNAPLPFVKLSPANLSAGLSTRLTLDWVDATEAASYAYCIDDDPNGTCTGSWTTTGEFSQATLAGLETDTTYEWQASASNTGGTTFANTATTWTFSTGSIAYTFNSFLALMKRPIAPPSAFTKIHPAETATGISTSPILDWADAPGALSYDFCYDLTVNGECTGGWTSTGTTSQVRLFGLPYNTTYEWQARAINSSGATYANNNTTWYFTTIPTTGTWTTITSENFETTIPKTGWSRHDYGTEDGGEYFIGRRNAPCPVYADSYSGWLIGAGAQGSALGCGAAYVPNQNSWFIYGPFSTLNATAGYVDFKFYVNSEAEPGFLHGMGDGGSHQGLGRPWLVRPIFCMAKRFS